MVLFDLLKPFFPALDENDCKVHLANTDGEVFPLERHLEGTFEEWQSWQSQQFFKYRHIISLIKLPEKQKFLFAGGYISDTCKYIENLKDRKYGDDNQYRYQTRKIDELEPISGSIVISFDRRDCRQPYRDASSCADRLFLCDPTPNLGELEEIMSQGRDGMSRDKLKDNILQRIKPKDVTEVGSNERDFEDEGAFPEGRILYRMHRDRERNADIVERKKNDFLKKHKCLRCEICGFDFAETYGDRGKGFIECHHMIPVSQLDPGKKTRLKDLCLVCSNCHRMLHRGGLCTPEELRKILSP